ncbi:MAG: transcriptional repressor LexA [Bacilli bacterium]|nr:transcriptional repressor LexA [Bacilli bacterium]
MKKEGLTTKQNEILTFIKKYTAKNNYPPSIREISKGVNLKSPATTHVHVKNLIDKGYLKRNLNNHKILELLVPNEFEKSDELTVQIPLLGKVTAGNPIEAIENPDEYFPIPVNLIPKNSEVFTLRVSGESMINAGILDNDIVIIERKNTAKNGEIVVAMNEDNEVTLKTFYQEENYIRLQPENDFMTPIILKNVTILGKAIGLYRKF